MLLTALRLDSLSLHFDVSSFSDSSHPVCSSPFCLLCVPWRYTSIIFLPARSSSIHVASLFKYTSVVLARSRPNNRHSSFSFPERNTLSSPVLCFSPSPLKPNVAYNMKLHAIAFVSSSGQVILANCVFVDEDYESGFKREREKIMQIFVYFFMYFSCIFLALRSICIIKLFFQDWSYERRYQEFNLYSLSFGTLKIKTSYLQQFLITDNFSKISWTSLSLSLPQFHKTCKT